MSEQDANKIIQDQMAEIRAAHRANFEANRNRQTSNRDPSSRTNFHDQSQFSPSNGAILGTIHGSGQNQVETLNSVENEQVMDDEEFARRLQMEENGFGERMDDLRDTTIRSPSGFTSRIFDSPVRGSPRTESDRRRDQEESDRELAEMLQRGEEGRRNNFSSMENMYGNTVRPLTLPTYPNPGLNFPEDVYSSDSDWDPLENFMPHGGSNVHPHLYSLFRAIQGGNPVYNLFHGVEGDSYEELIRLGESMGHVSKGAKPELIASLPVRTYTKSSDKKEEACSVCLIDYEDGDQIKTLPCAHSSHANCLDKWLAINKACTICREELK